MDINRILQKEAFKSLPQAQAEGITALSKRLDGKSANEAVILIMAYLNSLPKGQALTKQQKDSMLKAILEELSDQEKAIFTKMLSLVSM